MFISCTSQGESSETPATRSPHEDTITVSKGPITPTVSTRSDTVQQLSFVITLPTRGSFKGAVKNGQAIEAGTVLGWINDEEITAPVDAQVTYVASPAEDLPKNYAVLELQYQGFGILAAAKPLLKDADIQQLQGKFQVSGGVGPTDCQHIGRASASDSTSVPDNGESGDGDTPGHETGDSNSDTTNNETMGTQAGPVASTDQVICIIGKDVDVNAGQEANLVITGTRRDNVLVLPVGAIAGRIANGKVTKVIDGKPQETAVELGATDGAHIEIISGLQEGEIVSLHAPDIDPRRQ